MSPRSRHTQDLSTPSELLGGSWSHAAFSDKIAARAMGYPVSKPGLAAFLFTFVGMLIFLGAVAWLVFKGVGIWGINVPVVWGFAITNYVWWIGIGMAGTFISAALLVTRQRWRGAVSRAAESMTVFAVAIAGIFPILHLGRPWFFYWLAPYPNVMNVWPQWRSPLVWDFFAIGTYVLVSLMFWYVGLIPDFATLRDRAGTMPGRRARQVVYGLLALGWRGEARHWARYETASLMLAGLGTPLVVSVHTMVAMDFAIGNTPGYHSTIFPPFFVAGAFFSGFAMMLTLVIPLRRFLGLQDFITGRHLANAAKILLANSWLLAYGYCAEIFTSFYSGDQFERYMTLNRMIGPYAPVYWSLLFCNVVVPQLLWRRGIRHDVRWLFAISLIVNVGMWMERFIIVVSSVHRDFLPSSWGMFYPTAWDWIFLLSSVALFAWLFLLFVHFLPVIAMADMRKLIQERAEEPA